MGQSVSFNKLYSNQLVSETLAVLLLKSRRKKNISTMELIKFSVEKLTLSDGNNYFEGLYSDTEFKVAYILFHIFITFAGPLLMYSIVWYERYSADLWYRTLINQLLTHFCLLSIIGCFFFRLPYVGIILFGPFSSTGFTL